MTASVVMIAWSPHKHRLAVMKESVRTLRECTRYPYTFVVVDNGPTEQTEFIKSVNPDVHIVNEVNQHPAVARNQGAAATETDYIAFVDNDVRFYGDWLADSIALLEKYADRSLIAVLTDCPIMRKPKYFIGEIDGAYRLAKVSGSACWVMKRATFREIGPWSDATSTEDYDYSLRAGAVGYSFIYPIAGPRVVHLALHRPTRRYTQRFVEGKWI